MTNLIKMNLKRKSGICSEFIAIQNNKIYKVACNWLVNHFVMSVTAQTNGNDFYFTNDKSTAVSTFDDVDDLKACLSQFDLTI